MLNFLSIILIYILQQVKAKFEELLIPLDDNEDEN